MIPGNLGDNATPSCYVKYNEDGDAVAAAPLVKGTVTVSKSGNNYTFSYEVYDDFNKQDPSVTPHKISGTFTGTLPEFKDASEATAASVQDKAKRLGKASFRICK